MRPTHLAPLLLLAAPAWLPAQIGLAARASTLGIGAELSVRPAKNLGLRLGGNYLQFSRDGSIKDNSYTVTPHFENGTAILDLYPLGGAFHLSGGLLLNYNEGRLVAHPPYHLSGQTYDSGEVSSITGTVTFNPTAPYVGIGLAGQSRIALLFDLGVGFTGTPMVALTAETSLQGPARDQFEAGLQAEQQKVQDEINQRSYLKFHPVLSLGLKVGF